jgi:hypothetical protein
MTTWSRMTTEAAKTPTRLPPDCDTPPVRHQGPMWPQGNEHRGKCLVNVHANRPLTPPLRRMGQQQSVRWGRAAARKDQGQSGKVRGADAVDVAGSDRQCPRLTATVTATAAANGRQQRPATAHHARKIRANWGYVRPEKRTVARQQAATRAATPSHCTGPPHTGPNTKSEVMPTDGRTRTDSNLAAPSL